MTKTDFRFFPILIAFCLVPALFCGGCLDSGVEPFAEPKDIRESTDILRTTETGPIIVTYTSYPIRREAPPDGVRAAVIQAMGRTALSAATFFWSERELAMGWIREQMELRRLRGEPVRLILAGHGLGATEASETARELLFQDREFEIVLLLTVDAVKTGRIGSAAGVTGNAIVKRLPGVSHSFTAYDAAPEPDGKRVWSHINYYQDRSVYHGTAMPKAENHLIADWSGLLNHGNADDFAKQYMVADFRYAIRESLKRRTE